MKSMYKPLIVEFVVRKSNMDYWENINKERYFEIVSVSNLNETSNMIEARIDQLYLGFIFGDIFFQGVRSGMDSIIESQKSLN
jgi:hypothetical protein